MKKFAVLLLALALLVCCVTSGVSAQGPLRKHGVSNAKPFCKKGYKRVGFRCYKRKPPHHTPPPVEEPPKEEHPKEPPKEEPPPVEEEVEEEEVTPPSAGCTQTVTSANASSAIAAAPANAVLCLNGASVSGLNVSQAHKTNVTLKGPGTVGYSLLQKVSGLRFSGLHFTGGVDLIGASSDVRWMDDEFTGTFGIHGGGEAHTVSGSKNSNLVIEGDYFHHLDFTGSEGVANGYAITLTDGIENVTIRGNRFKEIANDYVQMASPKNATVVGNTFEGPTLKGSHSTVHQDLWQVFGGGSNLTYEDNAARNTGTHESLLFQTGLFSNVRVVNNLFDHDSEGYTCQLYQSKGLVFRDNTIVGSRWGCLFRDEASLGAGSGYEVDHNVFVGTAEGSGISTEGRAASWGTYDYNVSDDASASGAHSIRNWKPQFKDTVNYEAVGLPYPAGYKSGGANPPPVEEEPPVEEPPTEEPGTQTLHCFSNPSACGFPDTDNPATGVEPTATLTPSGSLTISQNGAVVQNLEVTGNINVTGDNVTIRNVKVIQTSTCGTTSTCGNSAIRFDQTANGTALVEHVTLVDKPGTTCEHAIRNTGGPSKLVVKNALITACDGAFYAVGPTEFVDSYDLVKEGIHGDHTENVYLNDTTFTAIHDTLLNPIEQTAVIFGNSNGGTDGGTCVNHITAENSLLVGGGFTIYECAHAEGKPGTGSLVVKNNHFARCLGENPNNDGGGGHFCTKGADTNGYWPRGGHFGLLANEFSYTWTGNIWDDNGATALPGDTQN